MGLKEPNMTDKFEDFLIEDLDRFFSKMMEGEDWRGPVDYWVDAKDYHMASVAVRFYTATNVKTVDANLYGLRPQYRIVADGYRAGPAGP